jgi:hypothetical protein
VRAAVAFGAGLLFAIGLAVGGMTDPTKVLAFLDLGGPWDPSLGLVMAGAIGFHLPAVAWSGRWGRPWLASEFHRAATAIDARLVGGAALFGVGWGLSGWCPGPALMSLATLRPSALVFVGAMTAGMALVRLTQRQQTVEAEPG